MPIEKKIIIIILNSPSVNILNFYVRVISLLPFFKLMTFLKKKKLISICMMSCA